MSNWTHPEDDVTYENRSTVSGGRLTDIKPEQRKGALRGAQLLAKALRAEGVEVLFGYPGGANLEIFDVLREFDIRCIRTEHERCMQRRVMRGPPARLGYAWRHPGRGRPIW